jgi:hypothetical protein
MSRYDDRARDDDVLKNHPLRDTQEFESDIRARQAATPGAGTAGAVGGVGGALAGAGLGTIVGGPVGAIVGAIAGAVGGWWAGQAATDATTLTPDDENRYRGLYEASPNRLADRSYEDVRPFYALGHIASQHPHYRGRPFDEIEEELQKGWTDDLRTRYGDWASVRPFAREAYTQKNRGNGA